MMTRTGSRTRGLGVDVRDDLQQITHGRGLRRRLDSQNANAYFHEHAGAHAKTVCAR